MSAYKKLKNIFENASHLNYLQRILGWEEMVTMPEGAGLNRAKALATLKKETHEKLTSKKVGNLLLKAKKENFVSEWDQANLRWFEKSYLSLRAIPAKLQGQATQASLLALQSWRKNREQNNWKDFLPFLKKSYQFIHEMAIRRSDALALSPYDVLIDSFSPGLTQAIIDPLFEKLRPSILMLRDRVLMKQKNETDININQKLSMEQQKKIANELMKAVGFNFNHGRLDSSHHPYCDGIASDIRITTRYNEDNMFDAFYGVLHETGHALYEQGMPTQWAFQPVGQPQCKLMHEGQALLYENEVGRSKAFFVFLEKMLHSLFGTVKGWSAENLYFANTRIKNPLIRVDCDELNYSLHILMRYEIEKALFNQEIKIEDLPSLWDEKMKAYFNLSTQDNFKDGVMQDIHWAFGYFGYFPIYLCGQLTASQIFSTFTNENPNFLNQINLSDLHAWLKKNIYAFASLQPTQALLKSSTGFFLDQNYFLKQIENRYLV